VTHVDYSAMLRSSMQHYDLMSRARLKLVEELYAATSVPSPSSESDSGSDPEDIQDGIDHEELPPTVTHSAGRTHDFVGYDLPGSSVEPCSASISYSSPSTLTELNDTISDPKYDGVRTTRKQLMDDSDGDANTPHESEEEEQSPFDRQSMDETPDGNESRAEQLDSLSLHEQEEDQSSTLQKNREQDRQKGKAIARQIVCCATFVSR
jgi:protein AATF/BFR2